MKYSIQKETEEEQKLNEYQNKLQENTNQSFLYQNKPQKVEWIYVNPSIYIGYCLLNGFSLSLGCFLKLIFPISRSSIGKKSILTGIPIIRNNYFVLPFFLNFIYFIWCIYNYNANASIRAIHEKNILEYLKHIRGAFFFTNILLLIIFYVLYYFIVLNIYKSYGFKISGHIIASILSGGMIVNLHNTYEPFIILNIGQNFNKYISFINTFLYYHSIYTIFWSSWIFHKVTELILAYIISVSSLIIAHVTNVDELFLNLIDFNYPKRNPVILYK